MAGTFGVAPRVLCNDAPEWDRVDLRDYAAVVVSPGPGRPQHPGDVGRCLDVLRECDLPVLGVCLGHQMMALLSGADVGPAPVPRHGFVDRIWHDGRDLFEGLPQGFRGVRYHSLCVADPPVPELVVTARGDDGVIMGLRHRDRPWWGTQFHPESIATEHGDRLMANFQRLIGPRPIRISGLTLRRRVN